MAEVEVGQLEEQAARRKERLAALKRRLGGEGGGEEGEGGHLPTPVFRSYKPETAELQGGQGLLKRELSRVASGRGQSAT